MGVLFAFRSFIQDKMKACLVITALMILFSCHQDDKCIESSNNKILDDIESVMLQYPERLDSLISIVDTLNFTQCDSARIYMIKGYLNYWNGNYIKSISELAKADVIFQKTGSEYYDNLNNLIKAFVFELLDLDNEAANLYVNCNDYFERNHLEKFKFYSTLGLLRFSKELNIEKNVLTDILNKNLKELNQPIFDGLFYSALGILETNDSLKTDYYEKAKETFILAKSWNRAYTLEINILLAKIRKDPSDRMLRYYQQLDEKYNFYIPTDHQKLKYRSAQAYLYVRQGKNREAIEIVNELLKEPDITKFPDLESYCVNLLSFLYMRCSNYRNAYYLLARDNSLQQKIREARQNSRLLALGAYYKYSQIEKEKINLKLRIQKFLLYTTIIVLIFLATIAFIWILLKESNHKQEILKLKNIEIEDQIQNLLHALENQNNTKLIDQVEKIGIQYKDSQLISRFKLEIDQGLVNNWNEFETKFMDLRFAWMQNLKQEFQMLSQTDLKYCMCLYLDLNNSTICKLCYISVDAIKSAKKRIRDKFALNDASEISTFLKNFD